VVAVDAHGAVAVIAVDRTARRIHQDLRVVHAEAIALRVAGEGSRGAGESASRPLLGGRPEPLESLLGLVALDLAHRFLGADEPQMGA